MVQRSTFQTHGPGPRRIHILGRSFSRMEEEGDKGGGGEAKGTQPGTAATSTEKTYTAAEVENIVKDRLARVKPKATEQPEKKTSKSENSGDPTWVFDLQDAIDAQTEERGVKIPQGLKKRMRSAFAAERPDDPSAWVGTWLDDVGLVKKADTTTTTTSEKPAEKKPTETTTTTQTPKPISDKGGAAVTTNLDEITNPNDLTEVDVERLYAKHGEDKANEMITKAVMKWFEDVKIVPDRGKPRR